MQASSNPWSLSPISNSYAPMKHLLKIIQSHHRKKRMSIDAYETYGESRSKDEHSLLAQSQSMSPSHRQQMRLSLDSLPSSASAPGTSLPQADSDFIQRLRYVDRINQQKYSQSTDSEVVKVHDEISELNQLMTHFDKLLSYFSHHLQDFHEAEDAMAQSYYRILQVHWKVASNMNDDVKMHVMDVLKSIHQVLQKFLADYQSVYLELIRDRTAAEAKEAEAQAAAEAVRAADKGSATPTKSHRRSLSGGTASGLRGPSSGTKSGTTASPTKGSPAHRRTLSGNAVGVTKGPSPKTTSPTKKSPTKSSPRKSQGSCDTPSVAAKGSANVTATVTVAASVTDTNNDAEVDTPTEPTAVLTPSEAMNAKLVKWDEELKELTEVVAHHVQSSRSDDVSISDLYHLIVDFTNVVSDMYDTHVKESELNKTRVA